MPQPNILNPGITVKTIPTLLLLIATAISIPAQAPVPTPTPGPAPTTDAEREAATRALLEKMYAESGKSTNPPRALPTRLNLDTNTARAASNAVTAAVARPAAQGTATSAVPVVPLLKPTNSPANATTAGAIAQTPAADAAAAAASRATNRTPRAVPVLPAFPLPGAATPPAPGAANPAAAAAVPVIPGAPAPNPAAPNVNAAVGPGAAGPGGNAAAGAAPANPEDEVFPPGLIKFSEADLSQVLEIYQELTGRTVLKPANLPQAKITIRSQTQLTRAEAIQALDSILSMNQITMVPQGEKFVKAVPQGQANQEANRFSELPWELLPESGTIVNYVVQLTNAAPQEVATVLQQFAKMPGNSILAIPSTSMLVIRDYAENVKRMLEMIQKIDVVPVQEFVDVVIPIKYALAGDIAQVLGSLTAGGGAATTVGRQQTRTGLSGVGGLGGAGGGAGGFPGQPGYNPNNPYGANPNAAGGLGAGGLSGAASGRSSFASRLNQIVNRAATGAGGDIYVLGQTKIIADERTNSLLIFASKADLVTISNIIDKLDVVLAQVLIEAIVMEVKVGNTLNYGFSYVQRKPSTIGSFLGIGSIGSMPFSVDNFATNGGGGFNYAVRFMDFDAALTAIAGDSRVNIISRPRIQTSHAVEANLFVGQTRPYVTGSYTYFGGGPQTQFQQQQIGLTLSVLPLINAEGLVVMDIKVKSQNVGENIPIDATFSVPETIDREAAAKVAVRDRETIMLGGFISKNKNVTKSGVPILKDIPILGALFRSTQNDESRVELIVLIRPTVLPSPKDAAIFAAEERLRLPAVRGAERDYQEDTVKRQKAEDRYQERELLKLHKKEGSIQ
jgi:general secretion pathway protein D